MAGISRVVRQSILDNFFSIASWTAPTAIYVALYSAAPSAVGGGTELSGDGYARANHAAWNNATAAEPSVVTNDGAIEFATASADWLTVTAVGLFDTVTSTGQTFLGYASITAKLVQSGDIARIADTKLEMKLDETA